MRFVSATALCAVVLAFSAVAAPAGAASGIPRIISYQGRLANSSGTLLGGSSGTTYYFRFSLHSASSGGSQLWPADNATPCTHSLTVTSGVFNASIGDSSSCSDILDYNFSSNEDVFLQTQVSSNGTTFETLTPRQRIASSAFSFFSQTLFGTSTQSVIGTTTPVAGAVFTAEATTTAAVPLAVKGFYGQTANLFQIQSAANADFFLVDSSGSVGIGTTTPGTKLAVHSGEALLGGAVTAFGPVKAPYFIATSSVASSFVNASTTDSFSIGNLLAVSGSGTSTFTGGISTAGLSSSAGLRVSAGDTVLAGGLAVSGSSNFTGSLGIGSTSPGSLLAVNGSILAQATSTILGGGLIAESLFATGTLNFYTSSNASPRLTIDTSGNIGVGTTGPSALFSVGGAALIGAGSASIFTLNTGTIYQPIAATTTIPNNQPYAWAIATSTANEPIIRIDTQALDKSRKATTTIMGGFQVEGGAISHDYSSGITSFDSIQTGPMAFDTDAGLVSWIAMPSSTTTAGIELGYTAQIGSASLLTLYSTTSSSGLVTTGFVGIATATPSAALSVRGAGDTANTFLAYMEDVKGNSRFVIRDAGNIGIGSTSPGSLLAVNGSILAQTGTSTFGGLISPTLFSTTTLGFYTSSNATPRMTIDSSGNVGIGTTNPDSKTQITGGGLCVGSDVNCNTDNNTEGTVYSGSTAMTVYDVAEMYPTKDTTLTPAEIIALDLEQGVFVKRASSPKDVLLGVISTQPAVLLGGFAGNQFKEEHQVAVALSGRVPVRVNTEGGEIKIGDRLTLSSVAGVAKKAEAKEQGIGIALENFPSPTATSTIQVFVNLGYSKLDEAISGGRTSDGGSTSPNLTNAWSVDQSSGKVSVNFFGDLNLNGNSIINVSKILGMWGKWEIDENGKLIAQEIETQKLKVGSPENRTGITIYDETTGEPMCAKSVNKVLTLVEGECGDFMRLNLIKSSAPESGEVESPSGGSTSDESPTAPPPSEEPPPPSEQPPPPEEQPAPEAEPPAEEPPSEEVPAGEEPPAESAPPAEPQPEPQPEPPPA